MSLHCLVYVSLSNQEMTEKDLKNLLKGARAEMKDLDITGLLLYRDGFYIQALEGEECKIDALFDRISKDPRHRDVTTVYKKPIQQRSFTDWTMGFSRIDDATALEKIDGYSDFLQNPTPGFFKAQPSYAQMLLENFKHDLLF